MTIILFLSLLLSGYQPQRGILAYATEMSHSGLLAATNAQRSSYGKKSLTLNSKLNQAAQAKANDMVARNYWSHNTPDGQEPWVFFVNAGYQYTKAGENLAYGFATSSDAVTGWMNSPSHKENLLDTDFSEVGFGYANGSDYNSSGQETVVVAMYATPLVLSANQESQQPAAPVTQAQNTPEQPSPPPVPAPAQQAPTQQSPEQKPSSSENAKTEETIQTSPSNLAVVANTKQVSRIEALTKGKAPWALGLVGFITGGLVVFMLLKHSYRLRHLLKDSENFILHHPLIDSTVIALIVLGITLSRTVGFIL